MTIAQSPSRVPELTLGVRLYMSRQETGLDRGAFADLIGIDRNAITRYENNRVAPRPIVLNAWALATGVDREWLRTGVPSAPPPAPGGGSAFVLPEGPQKQWGSVSTR